MNAKLEFSRQSRGTGTFAKRRTVPPRNVTRTYSQWSAPQEQVVVFNFHDFICPTASLTTEKHQRDPPTFEELHTHGKEHHGRGAVLGPIDNLPDRTGSPTGNVQMVSKKLEHHLATHRTPSWPRPCTRDSQQTAAGKENRFVQSMHSTCLHLPSRQFQVLVT